MKKIFCIALALLLMLSLMGCGAAMGDSAATAPSTPSTPSAPNPGAAADQFWGYDYDTPAEAPMEPSYSQESNGSGNYGGTNTSVSIPDNVKLIYTADIELESTAFDTAVSAIQSLASSCGGYFESSNMNNYSAYRSAWYTVRVPAENFENFCDTISKLGQEGEVLQVNNISRNARDVSEAYYDTESRLFTQQTKLERLQDLLAKAENMEDRISLEYAISDTELAIENLTGTLRHYDSLVGYSTITLYLSEVYKFTETEEPVIGFGAKLAAAFKSGCSRFVNGLQYTLLDMARHWVGWLIFLVIVAVAAVIVVRVLRRRKRAERARYEKIEDKDPGNKE